MSSGLINLSLQVHAQMEHLQTKPGRLLVRKACARDRITVILASFILRSVQVPWNRWSRHVQVGVGCKLRASASRPIHCLNCA